MTRSKYYLKQARLMCSIQSHIVQGYSSSHLLSLIKSGLFSFPGLKHGTYHTFQARSLVLYYLVDIISLFRQRGFLSSFICVIWQSYSQDVPHRQPILTVVQFYLALLMFCSKIIFTSVMLNPFTRKGRLSIAF